MKKKVISCIFAYLCSITQITKADFCRPCVGRVHHKEQPCCPRLAPPHIAYDFANEFNEKKVWMEFRNGDWYMCTQRLRFNRDYFNTTPNITCTKAYPTQIHKNAPEGSHCWRSGNRTICQNDMGDITVHG